MVRQWAPSTIDVYASALARLAVAASHHPDHKVSDIAMASILQVAADRRTASGAQHTVSALRLVEKCGWGSDLVPESAQAAIKAIGRMQHVRIQTWASDGLWGRLCDR